MTLAFWEWMIRGDETSATDREGRLEELGFRMREGKLKSAYGPYPGRNKSSCSSPTQMTLRQATGLRKCHPIESPDGSFAMQWDLEQVSARYGPYADLSFPSRIRKPSSSRRPSLSVAEVSSPRIIHSQKARVILSGLAFPNGADAADRTFPTDFHHSSSRLER